jgi:hypothetical protein
MGTLATTAVLLIALSHMTSSRLMMKTMTRPTTMRLVAVPVCQLSSYLVTLAPAL